MNDVQSTLYGHVKALFPICRSITGNGLRQTLAYIGDHIPLKVKEVESGMTVLDWVVPPEWNIYRAVIRTLSGRPVVDFSNNNLHILQYSQPLNRVVQRDELEAHLHSVPEQPDLVPYRTAYYANTWGFCLAHRDRLLLTDSAYHVEIDSTLTNGSLSYGECYLPGESTDEVLFSAHSCHPSLANDNLSSIAVAIELAQHLAAQRRRFSYRFLFAPGTIGAIAWLHFNRGTVERIRHGLVLSCLGDDAPPSYKRSRRGAAAIDRYAAYVLGDEGCADRIFPFTPTGYDERQYCSPGFDLPMGRLSRSPGGRFPQYHTSDDNLAFVTPSGLADSLRVLRRIVGCIEDDEVWVSTAPYGEPQFNRRGVNQVIEERNDETTRGTQFDRLTSLWVLNLADGHHSLFDMAERSGQSFEAIAAAASALHSVGLLVRAP